MDDVPEAQAVITVSHIPFIPNLMAIFAAAILQRAIGIKKGDTRPGPFSIIFRFSFSIIIKPPMPLPKITPQFSRESLSLLNPASFTASFAATIPIWVNLSILFNSLESRTSAGLKSLISAAIFTLNSAVSNALIKSIPHLPFFILSQKVLTLLPMGVIAPIPVITTLFFKFFTLLALLVFYQYLSYMVQFANAAPQVNPPPKATIITRFPGQNIFFLWASSKASGILAEEVFPKRSKLIINLCRSTFNSRATLSI